MNSKSQSVSISIVQKFVERFGTQVVNIFLNILLARMLLPEDYGTLGILNVFIVLAQVISQNGINNVLVQMEIIEEEDYGTGLCISLFLSTVLYLFIFWLAPYIAFFYDMPQISLYLRIVALSLFPGAVTSIYNAKVQRNMQFKTVMITGFVSNIASCALGVVAAYMGWGVWSLIICQVSASIIMLIMYLTLLKWKISPKFSKKRAKRFFNFGSKIIVASLIDNLYYDFENLFVGKAMSRDVLGFYSNGRTYPLRVISSVKDTISGVIFPAMSNSQNNDKRMKELARKSIQLFSFIVFPTMIGFSLVAKEFVLLFLTDKWMNSLMPMQMFSIGLAFLSLSAPNIQIIKAKGMGTLYLVIECIRKGLLLFILLITALIWGTIEAVSIGSMVVTIVTAILIMQICGKQIHYTVFHQLKDISKNIIGSLVMSIIVIITEKIMGEMFPEAIVMIVKILLGIVGYTVMAIILKNQMLYECLQKIKHVVSKNDKR